MTIAEVVVDDPDAPRRSGSLTVTLEGSGADVLSLERRGGGYSLVLGRELDRETRGEVEVQLVARDTGFPPHRTELNVKFRLIIIPITSVYPLFFFYLVFSYNL